MTPPEISICIPTHHGRMASLRDTLLSIEAQLEDGRGDGVEVCVSDGGTADGTAEMVMEVQSRRPGWLRYQRSEHDFGFAHHLFESIEMARGTHVWMFSSDDAIAPGGITRVRTALADQPDLVGLTCSVAMYDASLSRVITTKPQFFYPSDPDRPHRYGGAAQITAELGVIFAYFAAHIVRRDAWDAAIAAQRAGGRPVSRYFPHMDVFVPLIRTSAPWAWLPDRVIQNRTGNDSWTPRVFGGDVSRYWVAILADLSRLYNDLAGGRQEIRRNLLTTWIGRVASPEQLTAYRLAPGAGTRRDLTMLVGFGRTLWRCPAFWRESLPCLLTPRRVLVSRTGE